MKLRTSQILAQLSEQDRNKVEADLAELNQRKMRLIELQQSSALRIQQLHSQRDQALHQHNAASLLQTFELSLREQQLMLKAIDKNLSDIESDKQQLLTKFAEAYRTHHTYAGMRDQLQQEQQRQQEQKQQRQMDDMSATRRTRAHS